MSRVFFLTSSGSGAGLTTVALGMVRALDQQGFRTGFCKPVAQLHAGDQGLERSTQLVTHIANIKAPVPISLRRAESLLGSGKLGLLMEEVVALYRQIARHKDVVIIEGLVADGHAGYATRLNAAIAQALDAEVILIAQPETDMDEYIGIASGAFSDANDSTLTGIIINKVTNDSEEKVTPSEPISSNKSDKESPQQICPYQKLADKHALHLIACIPRCDALMAPRTSDIVQHIGAEILHPGELQRRVLNISLCARTLANIHSIYKPHSLLIIPGDRDDIFVAACMSAMNGVPLAGIILTGGLKPSDNVMALCSQAMQLGVPILTVKSNSYQTATDIAKIPAEIGIDDFDLIDQAMEHVSACLDTDWLKQRCARDRKPRLSPAAFRYQLIQLATQRKRVIVLPEGEEPRTIMAAHQCQQRGIAQCILLGDSAKIHQFASTQGISLDESINIIDPSLIRDRYIEPMVALRQHKGLTRQVA
ncbi:MAG: phosphate acyltransferase, partial [Mariprofundaceae bacterium]|nr:phosphate acyltransferase [Mariprofundaceae bacterium]